LERLKQNPLYSVEAERLAKLEAEQMAAAEAAEQLRRQLLEEAAALEQLRCQLCSLVAGTRLQLLEHYSGQHLMAELAVGFADIGIYEVGNELVVLVAYDLPTG
jgi:hypothetical protein